MYSTLTPLTARMMIIVRSFLGKYSTSREFSIGCILASQSDWHLQMSMAYFTKNEFVAIYLTLLVILTTKVNIFLNIFCANVFKTAMENILSCQNVVSLPYSSGSVKVHHTASQS